MKILLESRCDSYSTEQCGRTMTVEEIIEYLEQFDEDSPVYISNDNGYTYGKITESSFEEREEDEEL